MAAYKKPTGYNTLMFEQGSLIYKPWNGYVSGDTNNPARTATGGACLPGRFGKNYCFLPDTLVVVVG